MADQQEQLQSRIRERARRDPDFRAQLREDPSAALAATLGVDRTEGVRVRVVEAEPGEVVLVLRAPAGETWTLDDLGLGVSGAASRSE